MQEKQQTQISARSDNDWDNETKKNPIQWAVINMTEKDRNGNKFKAFGIVTEWKARKGFLLTSDQWPVTSDQWPVTSDQWPVTSDQWPVTSDQWPVTSDQWPVTIQIIWSEVMSFLRKVISRLNPYWNEYKISECVFTIFSWMTKQ